MCFCFLYPILQDRCTLAQEQLYERIFSSARRPLPSGPERNLGCASLDKLCYGGITVGKASVAAGCCVAKVDPGGVRSVTDMLRAARLGEEMGSAS